MAIPIGQAFGATPTRGFRDELIREIFGQRPELSYLGNLGQGNLPRNMQDFFRGQTSNYLRQLQQAQGQQLVGGGLPTITPEDFFGGLDFQREFRNFSPLQRGLGTSRLSPRTQFFF